MSGMIVWRGKSLLDRHTPIVVILTGFGAGTVNRKTGAMVQSYILVDGTYPAHAVHTGRDAAICGDCKHRGRGDGVGRSCYVSLGTGLSSVHRAKAVYPTVKLARAALDLEGRELRIGTYGDPAAVPSFVWAVLLERVAGWTGYTHQWRTYVGGAGYLMASVDSEAERAEAKALGWRTFRVRSAVAPLALGEVVCPASAEAGHRAQCADCQLCRGASLAAKDVAIVDHSPQGRRALRRLPMANRELFA